MAPKPKTSGYRPFEKLRGLVDQGKVRLSPDTEKLAEPPPKVNDELSDEDVFRQAMKEVRPLGWSSAPVRLPGPVEIPERSHDEPEALARLQALVKGREELDPFATGEGIEGASSRRGRVHLGKLKNGDYSVQAHLDLHGWDPKEAKEQFETFIRESQHRGYSCVRIVHGRGKHSSSEPAVIKTHLTRWLSSRKMSRAVAAFASARWKDGGSGAVYVLLFRMTPPSKSSFGSS